MNQSIKKDFPLLKREENGYPICYLDNASTSQKPQSVIDAITNFYMHHNANIGRGVYRLAEEATVMYEAAREKVAQFIGAQPHETIFTKNATEGINCIASSWARTYVNKDDVIVLTELEHHANLLPWQRVAHETGAHIRFIPVNMDGTLNLSSLDSIITKEVKLVAPTQSSNALGTLVDVSYIIQAAHAVGAKVLVDACQSAPHQPINVAEMEPDFLVFSGHKMLGPTGIGVLYINEKLHEEIAPFNLGGGVVYEAQWQHATLLKSPAKFEGGTPPIAQAIGLAAAVDYLQKKIDFKVLQNYEAGLCKQLIDGLSAMPSVRILGPVNELGLFGHVVTFVVANIHPHDVSAYLDQKGICVRAGHFCAQPLINKLGFMGAVRASVYLYNTREDIDRLLAAVHEMIKEMPQR